MELVRARWQELENTPGLQQRVDALAVDNRLRAEFTNTALAAHSNRGKVFWLREATDLVGKAAAPHAACRRGCSDCCHIGVTVNKAEAEVIGREIGRRPAKPPRDRLLMEADVTEGRFDKQRKWQQDAYFGVPCTFLAKDGACSIYEHRPLICRMQINLDVDNLLCKLVPEGHGPVRVPYVNMTDAQSHYVMAFGTSAPMADIRDWFPRKEAPMS